MAGLTLISRQGDTLDALLWREASLGPAAIGPVLAANPGIAALGPILPTGTRIALPDDIASADTQTRTLVQLWT